MLSDLSGASHNRTLRALYVSYLSLDDPLVDTQVVAYLAGLAKLQHTIHLLTFETRALTRVRRHALRKQLAMKGIAWHGLRYHKRPTLFATAIDVLAGAIVAAWLIRRHRLDAFHARSHVPAAMALITRHFVKFRLIFDIRGLMAEEYVDAERWRRDSLRFRLTKSVERRALRRAEAAVVLTQRARDCVFGDGEREKLHVIPCCADIDRFEAAREKRAEIRRRLGFDGRTVLVYVGKFTGWYMEREMVEFFAVAGAQRPEMHFLILTQSESESIEREFARLDIESSSRTIMSCESAKVGEFLAAADAAIAFIRPSFSKISSSPTKVGEYLAAGLPMVCISGVGDVDELLRGYRVGVLLDRWDLPELERGAQELWKLIADEALGGRARAAARDRLSLTGVGIPAYDALYRGLSRI